MPDLEEQVVDLGKVVGGIEFVYECAGTADDPQNIADLIDKFYRQSTYGQGDESMRLIISGQMGGTNAIVPVAQNNRYARLFLDFRNCRFPSRTRATPVFNSNRGNHRVWVEGLTIAPTSAAISVVSCRGPLYINNCYFSPGRVTSSSNVEITNSIVGSVGCQRGLIVDSILNGHYYGSKGDVIMRNVQMSGNSISCNSGTLNDVICSSVYANRGPLYMDNCRTGGIYFLYNKTTILNCWINVSTPGAFGIRCYRRNLYTLRIVNTYIQCSQGQAILCRKSLDMERCRIVSRYAIEASGMTRIVRCRIDVSDATVGDSPGVWLRSIGQGGFYHPALIADSYIRSANSNAIGVTMFRTGLIKVSGCMLIGRGITPIPVGGVPAMRGNGPYGLRVNAGGTGTRMIVENCEMRGTRAGGDSIDPCLYQATAGNSLRWNVMGNRVSGQVMNINGASVQHHTANDYIYCPQYANQFNVGGAGIGGDWQEVQ